MQEFAFVFTIFFMLVGPIKLIPSFSGLMRDAESPFKRRVAIWSIVIASVLCVFVALIGTSLMGKYRISLEALRLSTGLVLLLSALQVVFQKAQPTLPPAGKPAALQLAASPMAVPLIVPPAGIAFILVCMMLAPQYPGMMQAVALCLAIIMTLNFLVMFFIDRIIKTPGLGLVLTVLGSVLVFVQICLAVQTMINGLQGLGVFKV
jgi:multiple antibiotic resistance protein